MPTSSGPCASNGANQFPIARADPPGALVPAVSFFGGFRTPALVPVDRSALAGIRNPSQNLSATLLPQRRLSPAADINTREDRGPRRKKAPVALTSICPTIPTRHVLRELARIHFTYMHTAAPGASRGYPYGGTAYANPDAVTQIANGFSTTTFSYDADKAEKLLRNLAQRLERDWSGVSGSILEGIDEILTVTRLGLPKELRRSLACTNMIENVMGTVRRVCRNVKRWRSASMAMRWTAAAMQEAAKGFRRLKAHKQLPALRSALEAHQNAKSHRVLVRQADAA